MIDGLGLLALVL